MDENLIKIKSEESRKRFPHLKLEDNEYVVYAFSRAKICKYMIIGGTAAGLAVILLAFLLVLMGQDTLDEMGRNFLYIILTCLVVAALIIGCVALMVYRGNKLFVTNKHVIQMVMKSPVATSFNIIDLAGVEDASFHQNGLMQKIFRYGTFRLSTVGDETTYTFEYSDVTPEEIKGVSELILKAKNRKKRKLAKSSEAADAEEIAEVGEAEDTPTTEAVA